MKVKQYKYNSRPFYSIVDDMDCPVDPYVSCYINNSLIAKAPNTTKRYVNELLFILKYFDDLPSRVSSGKFITQNEYSNFYDHCYYQQGAIKNSSVMVFPTLEDKHLRNVIASNQRTSIRVSPETIQGRIRRLRNFLEWLYEQFHFGNNVDDQTFDKFHKLISKMKLEEESLGSNRSSEVSEPEMSVIPDDVFANLLEMILPSSPNNPFKLSKVRNYFIVSLFIQTGIRRGALAKIKISDCHFYGSYDTISIYRSGIDKTDTRLEIPNQKTKSHMATIEQRLLKQIKYYIDHIRSKYQQTKTHDFLFVSEKNSKGTAGLPLSLKSINGIFEKLSRTLGFNIHPHLLRHKWNEIFDKEGEENGVDPSLLEDIRKYAMGWSANSTMNEKYNEKRLYEKAREISKAHQQRVNKKC